jgi:hypothetical protein
MNIENFSKNQEQGKEVSDTKKMSQEGISPLSYIIDEDEFFAVHEEMFKSGQAMRVDESAEGYKERVEELWKKRKEQLRKEREGVQGDKKHEIEDEVSPETLDKAIREVYNKEYFARKGHLSDDLFAVSHGADPDSEEAVRLFECVSGEVGEHFDAHGIDKLGQINSLLGLLSSGIDSSRDFYTAPFELTNEKRQTMAAAMGTSGGTAYKGGLAVVTGGYGESLREKGIKHVFINDVYKAMIPFLAKRFPLVQVHALSEQKSVLEEEAKNHQQ